MKLPILIFAFALALTASAQYVQLKKAQINANSEFLNDLADFGVGYVLQKGVYESITNRLPGVNYDLTKIEKIERKSTTAAADYRFTVFLTEQSDYNTVRATFTIKYDHRNNAFVVSSYRYTVVDFDGQGQGASVRIDVRPFNYGKFDEVPALRKHIQNIVKEAINKKNLPKSTYTLEYVYGAYQIYESGTKWWWVKLVNGKGQYFRLVFTFDPKSNEGDSSYRRVQVNYPWKRV